jgi:hypothetical protein
MSCDDTKRHFAKRTQQGHARKALLNSLGLEDSNLQACHKCKNDSSMPNGFVCQNPDHLYLGTHTDNFQDRPEQMKRNFAMKGTRAAAGKGAASQLKNGTHITQIQSEEFKKRFQKAGTDASMRKPATCPHCGKEGKNMVAMKRWHFDNCKEVK